MTIRNENGLIQERMSRVLELWPLQTDPRGGTLYLSREPIPANDCNRAFFVA